jgi:hypothetical protein
MPASRLARIGAWTGAAVAWGTTTVLVRVAAAEPAETALPPPPTQDSTAELGITDATLPNPPDGGLVIIRYTPVTAPPQEVIVKTRYVQVQADPGAATVSAPAPAATAKASTAPASTATAAPATGSVAPPAPVVVATPTTQPPAPPSSGS